jgi:tRNA threonylcarbamoyladenosine biosynthesis protein TsaE
MLLKNSSVLLRDENFALSKWQEHIFIQNSLYSMQDFTTYLNDEAATAALGAALARALAPGLAIHLHGDLGAGKTALTRALLHAAGHQGHVKSPTYTLVEPYRITLQGEAIEVFHFDLYRLACAEEFLEAGFREHFGNRAVCIVEWPEKAEGVLPSPDIIVKLDIFREGREVELRALSDEGSQCLERLKFASRL